MAHDGSAAPPLRNTIEDSTLEPVAGPILRVCRNTKASQGGVGRRVRRVDEGHVSFDCHYHKQTQQIQGMALKTLRIN